jgi:hypothetical protein
MIASEAKPAIELGTPFRTRGFWNFLCFRLGRDVGKLYLSNSDPGRSDGWGIDDG